MRIHIANDEQEFAEVAADAICDVVRERRSAAIGLPSGKTPLSVYDEVARRVASGALDFSGVTAFAIDELHGLPPDHPATNASYVRRHLIKRLPLRALHVMDSAAADPQEECERFARLIADGDGLDLVVLGIGPNGHVAFNEPGSPFDSRARLVALEPATRETYIEACGTLDATPAYGLTLGIGDLLEARRALLLASGSEKASVVARALEGPLTESLPASALQRHAGLTVVLDRLAASKLKAAKPKR